MNAIALSGLAKRYGDTWAVRDLSLVAPTGSFVSLLGPSGCGKTTTLRLIGGFETPERGEIVIAGIRANDVPPWRRGLGIVFQSYALFPFMTVFDNVAFGLRRQGRTDGLARRVAEMLDLVGLGALAARYPRQLSGGQQQRVALARALAIEPSVLLLDEPLSNLDAKLRAEMRLELKRIQRQTGVTTILVTHDQEEALTLSDEIVIMNAGVVVASGAPRRIWAHPGHEFVAGFLGVENLLPATVLDSTHVRVDGGDATLALAPDAAARAGGRVVVGIRSADIAVLPRGSAGQELPNRIDGTVRESGYRGAVSSFQIATPLAGRPLLATGSQEWPVGADVTVHLPPASLMRLAPTAAP
ncbi:MAG: ABC transporter ATP-binding protein [Alphaproteobacteria bacterium]|nr:ABC transporter ATP-binding protein [Alphaproteobacteria bacterium]